MYNCTGCERPLPAKDLYLCAENSPVEAPCFECLCLPCLNAHRGRHEAASMVERGN